jgi:hypothetical protein
MSEPSVVAATVVAQQPQPNSNSGGNSNNTQSIADYLAQLLKDKKSLSSFPNVFLHMERLLDDGMRTN